MQRNSPMSAGMTSRSEGVCFADFLGKRGSGNESSKQDNSTPPILKDDHAWFVRRVIQKLDAFSYLQFMLSCKKIHALCKQHTPFIYKTTCTLASSAGDREPIVSLRSIAQPDNRHLSVTALDQLRRAARQGRIEIIVQEIKFMEPPTIPEFCEQGIKELSAFLKLVGVERVDWIDPQYFTEIATLEKFVSDFNVHTIGGYWKFNPKELSNEGFQHVKKLDIAMSEQWLREDPTAWDFLVRSAFSEVDFTVEEEPVYTKQQNLSSLSDSDESLDFSHLKTVENDDEGEKESSDGSSSGDDDEEEEFPDPFYDYEGGSYYFTTDSEDEARAPYEHGLPVETFKRILEAWTRGEKEITKFSCDCVFTEEEYMNTFKTFLDMRVVGADPRPLYYIDGWQNNWLLRADGRVLCCRFEIYDNEQNTVEAYTVEPHEYPLVFKELPLPKVPKDAVSEKEKTVTWGNYGQASLNEHGDHASVLQALREENELFRDLFGEGLPLIETCHDPKDLFSSPRFPVKVKCVICRTTDSQLYASFQPENGTRPLSMTSILELPNALRAGRAELDVTSLEFILGYEMAAEWEGGEPCKGLAEEEDYRIVDALLKYVNVEKISNVNLNIFELTDPLKQPHNVSRFLEKYHVEKIVGDWTFPARAIILPGFQNLENIDIWLRVDFWNRSDDDIAMGDDLGDSEFLLKIKAPSFVCWTDGTGEFNVKAFRRLLKAWIHCDREITKWSFPCSFTKNDFISSFSPYTEIASSSPTLPSARPLVISGSRSAYGQEAPVFWLLREDHSVLECVFITQAHMHCVFLRASAGEEVPAPFLTV